MVSPSETPGSPSETLTRAARAHASTLGGGRILAVAARKRRRRESDAEALQALAGEDPLAQADRLLLESGYPGTSPQRLAARGAFTVKSAEKALAGAGRASKVSEDLWFGATALLDLRRRVLAHLSEHGSIDAQSFKELTGLTRKGER